jgi:hypothetical protein
MTQISAKSVETLVGISSLEALDVTGTTAESDAIKEFERRRPDCLVCDSQPLIIGWLHDDSTIKLRRTTGSLQDAVRILNESRRGPDAFGNAPQLLIMVHEDVDVRRQESMIAQLRVAARAAGYQRFQVPGRTTGPP